MSACPTRPDKGRVRLAVYDVYDIQGEHDGSNPVHLTKTPGYDARPPIAKDGRIGFTSVLDGDMEISSEGGWLMLSACPHAIPDVVRFFFLADVSRSLARRNPAAGAELDEIFLAAEAGLVRPTSVGVRHDRTVPVHGSSPTLARRPARRPFCARWQELVFASKPTIP